MKAFMCLALAAVAMAIKLEITVPPHVPHPKDDMYVCTGHKAPADVSHVHHFKPLASNYVGGAVHHMILFGCETPFKMSGTWDCESNICGGGSEMLTYAWAKKAPELKMQKGAGFVVGGDTKYKYFVLQQHFLKAEPKGLPHKTGIILHYNRGLPNRYAGMFVLMVQQFSIPPYKKKVSVGTKCEFDNDKPIDIFAYRTHAHDIGKMVIGHQDKKELVRHSPQIPEAFNEFKTPVKVLPGDIMSVQCNYDSSKRGHTTNVGSTHLDEMCNLYYMFLSETPSLSMLSCAGADGSAGFFSSHVELINVSKENSLLQSGKSKFHKASRSRARASSFLEEAAEEEASDDEEATAEDEEATDDEDRF